MPANAAIVVNNGTANVTLSPKTVDGAVFVHQDKTTTFVEGRISSRVASNAMRSGIRKVTVSLTVPRVVDETINGVTASRVADFGVVKSEFFIPPSWDAADIAEMRLMAADLGADALVTPVIDEAEGVW